MEDSTQRLVSMHATDADVRISDLRIMIPCPPDEPLVAQGRSFASFGEIVQGQDHTGEDFLVTLPVDIWSECDLLVNREHGDLTVRGAGAKSLAIAKDLVRYIDGLRGRSVEIAITSSVPIGKGLSSSTADMLAIVRAFQNLIEKDFPPEFISRLMANVEPHDALHYPTCTIYNHRKGRLIAELGYVPRYRIVALDRGGTIDTVEYNRSVKFTGDQRKKYSELLDNLRHAFDDRDDEAIAHVATENSQYFAASRGFADALEVISFAREVGALGVITAHSGTFLGVLLDPGWKVDECTRQIREFAVQFGFSVFQTETITVQALSS